jgi:hypothetical protein
MHDVAKARTRTADADDAGADAADAAAPHSPPSPPQQQQQQQQQRRSSGGGSRGGWDEGEVPVYNDDNDNDRRGGNRRGGGNWSRDGGGGGGGERRSYNNDPSDGGGGERSYGAERSYAGDRGGDRSYGGGGRGGGPRTRGGRGGPRAEVSPEAAALTREIREAGASRAGWRPLQALFDGASSGPTPVLDAVHASMLLDQLSRADQRSLPSPGSADRPDFDSFVGGVFSFLLDAAEAGKVRPRSAAQTLSALARMRVYNEELVTALLAVAGEGAGGLAPRDVGMLLWALGRLGAQPGDAWLDSFLAQTERRLRDMGPVELANAANGLAKMGARPNEDYLAALSGSAMHQLADFSERELPNLVYGLAALGWRPSSSSSGGGGGGGEDDGFSGNESEALQERSLPHLPLLRVPELSRMLWALTQFLEGQDEQGEQPAPPLLPDWARAMHSRLASQASFARPADLASALYALAYLRAPPDADSLGKLLAAVQAKLNDASADDLASVAVAVAQFGGAARPAQAWTDAVADAAASPRRLSRASAEALRNLAAALPALCESEAGSAVVASAVAKAQARLAELEAQGNEAAAVAV